MEKKFIIAFLIGVVLQWISEIALYKYIISGESNEKLREYKGFHVAMFSLLIGTLLKYSGILLLLSYLVYKYIL